MDIPFTKMHGLGNDFMVVDNRSQSYEFPSSVVQRWADRRTGIGFDQLLIVQEASVDNALFDYRIFNSDGSEVEHCGNGARCFARYVYERGMTTERTIPVNTAAGLITLRLLDNDEVTVNLGIPQFEPKDIPLLSATGSTQSAYALVLSESDASAVSESSIHSQNELERITFGALSIGNPHAVLRVRDVDTAPVEQLGSIIESHSAFPARVNVGFMQVLTDEHIRLRVFERGVGETLACGTGAGAAVATGIRQAMFYSL